MTDDIRTEIQRLFSSYQPLSNIDRQLIGRNQEDNFRSFVNSQLQNLSEEKRQRVWNEIFGWGPIHVLKERDDIYDILIQGPQQIFYEDASGMHQLDDEFASEKSYLNFVDRITSQAEILVNLKDPFGNGKVDGFRLHVAHPPITSAPTLTLRRQRTQSLTFDELSNSQFFNSEQRDWLNSTLENRGNFLVIGPTGSGKTTFLNALLGQLKETERLVVIEDTDEIKLSHPLSTKLLSREICPNTLTSIAMSDLVKQSLRMRPDRLVIGEVRGPEAKDLLLALATGHSGSMGTLHASSAHQALLRLEMLVQMGAPQWSLYSIRQLIHMSLDYLIVLKEDRQQKGILEIAKLSSLESFGILLENVFPPSSTQARQPTVWPLSRQ